MHSGPAATIAIATSALITIALMPGAQASHASFSVPNDPYFDMQWGLKRIKAPQAWQHADGSGAVIAMADTGIDLEHPEFEGKIRPGYACWGTSTDDWYGQGTHLAGIAAASTNNGEGVAGVAPEATLMPLKMLSSKCPLERWPDSIRWAARRGADVISLTWFLGAARHVTRDNVYRDIAQAAKFAWRKGAVVIATAGNGNGIWVGNPVCAPPFHLSPIVCVGSVNRFDVLATTSNYDAGMKATYLVAPGGEYVSIYPAGWLVTCEDGIVSTWLLTDPGGESVGCDELPAGYESTAGARFAAAHVAGVAALLVSQGLINEEVVHCLISTAEDLGAPGRDSIFGFGLVDAEASTSRCSLDP